MESLIGKQTVIVINPLDATSLATLERPANLFGRSLKATRERKGISKELLAKNAGLSVSTIGQIERGSIKRPPMKRLVSFADTLGLPVELLISWL